MATTRWFLNPVRRPHDSHMLVEYSRRSESALFRSRQSFASLPRPAMGVRTAERTGDACGAASEVSRPGGGQRRGDRGARAVPLPSAYTVLTARTGHTELAVDTLAISNSASVATTFTSDSEPADTSSPIVRSHRDRSLHLSRFYQALPFPQVSPALIPGYRITDISATRPRPFRHRRHLLCPAPRWREGRALGPADSIERTMSMARRPRATQEARGTLSFSSLWFSVLRLSQRLKTAGAGLDAIRRRVSRRAKGSKEAKRETVGRLCSIGSGYGCIALRLRVMMNKSSHAR